MPHSGYGEEKTGARDFILGGDHNTELKLVEGVMIRRVFTGKIGLVVTDRDAMEVVKTWSRCEKTLRWL